MAVKFVAKNKHIIIYSVSMAVLLMALRWLELRFIFFDHAFELYVGAIALIFTGLGIWLALKLAKPKVEKVIVERKVVVEVQKEVYVTPTVVNGSFVLNEEELNRLGISKRELEVLQLMAEGLSNQEIAARLFVSLNTVKTHSSKIFEKLDVKRRTQAVEKGKRVGLIG